MSDLIGFEKSKRDFTLLKGGDLTMLNFIEDMGGKYYNRKGEEEDIFQILARNGFNIARLRAYNNPGPDNQSERHPGYYLPEGYQNKDDMLKLARRARDVGMQLQISLHYSDWWTNGEVQEIPHKWQKELKDMDNKDPVRRLEEMIYNYTLDVMKDLLAQETIPEYLSPGNEIQGGMLYPFAKIPNWSNLSRFLNAAYDAVKEMSPETEVIIHLDDAGNTDKYEYFFNNCEKYGLKYDIIGSSYYPFWSRRNIEEVVPWFSEIGKKFNKPIMIMETAYNWNPTLPDGNPGQLKDTGPAPYPSSPQGQKDFMLNLFNAIRKERDNYILGSLYWDPIMIEHEGVGWAMISRDIEKERPQQAAANVVSNTTFFDFQGRALPVLDAYHEEN